MKITSVEALNEKIESCTKALDEKIKGLDGKRHIVLCGGTGCLSSPSDKIKEKFGVLLPGSFCEDLS